jgi:hypothetical protein
MKRRTISISWLAATAAIALAACTERPQTIGQGSGHDAAAFQGPTTAFTATGWKPGEKNSWEQALKTRTVNGQNEYTRVN